VAGACCRSFTTVRGQVTVPCSPQRGLKSYPFIRSSLFSTSFQMPSFFSAFIIPTITSLQYLIGKAGPEKEEAVM